uniref:Uncharacterized protein n=1 Tax=Arundo donax TaxID=35708 RepID=A0A0A9C2A6_ARUDO
MVPGFDWIKVDLVLLPQFLPRSPSKACRHCPRAAVPSVHHRSEPLCPSTQLPASLPRSFSSPASLTRTGGQEEWHNGVLLLLLEAKGAMEYTRAMCTNDARDV